MNLYKWEFAIRRGWGPRRLPRSPTHPISLSVGRSKLTRPPSSRFITKALHHTPIVNHGRPALSFNSIRRHFSPRRAHRLPPLPPGPAWPPPQLVVVLPHPQPVFTSDLISVFPADALLSNQAELVSSLCADSGRVATQAKLEIILALSKVKGDFATLDFATTVKRDATEYARGIVRKPKGLIVIVTNAAGKLGFTPKAGGAYC